MEKRNFNITIASILIGLTCFWLSVYNFILLDTNPLDQLSRSLGGVSEDETIVIITGKVTAQFNLSLADIKSSNYTQVKNQNFHFINAIGREFEAVYSGASLWSILSIEGILAPGASTFTLYGYDGFKSPVGLSLSLAENNPTLVILAYEKDGVPLFQEGPIRSIINHSVIPTMTTTHFSIQNLVKIEIG